MKLLLITVLFLTKALCLPASPSSISAIFSAIPTSAIPTSSSPALFSAIPTSAAPTPSPSSIPSGIAVTAIADSNDTEMLQGDDDTHDDADDDVDSSPGPTLTPAHNMSGTYNHTDPSPSSPYHVSYQQPQHNTNVTPPYLNSTMKSTSNSGENDNDNDNDDDTPISTNVSTNNNTTTDENDNGDENDDDDGSTDDNITTLPPHKSPVAVSSNTSSSSRSTADLIPDSRTAAHLQKL